MSLKPWREVAVPHADVLKGTFQQSEFAADITAVQTGKAPPDVPGRGGVLRADLHHRGDAAAAHPGGPAAERPGRRAGHPAADGVRRRQDAHHAGRPAPGDAGGAAVGPARHPDAGRAGRADGRAAGEGGGDRRHRPRPRPAVEARRGRRSRRSGASWPGSSAAATGSRWCGRPTRAARRRARKCCATCWRRTPRAWC